MMHEWKSQEKLIEECETQRAKDPLFYDIFQYEKNEWDNVPSVIPRFSFYLQEYVKGISQFCHKKSLEETTKHLREEVFQEIKRLDKRIDDEENQRKNEFSQIQDQIQELQKQIDEINDEDLMFKQEIDQQGKEQFLNERFLGKGDQSQYQWEVNDFNIDYQLFTFNKPRMMTIKQIRDVVFSLLNNSVALTRIKENEIQIDKLHTKCYKLAYDDDQLANKLATNVESIRKQFEDVWKDLKQTKLEHERKFGEFFGRITNNFDSIKKLKNFAEEQKAFQEMILNKSENIISRINKVRDNIMDDLKMSKSELTSKIEETDKFFSEQLEIIQAAIERNKLLNKEQLGRAKEDLQSSIKHESNELKVYINKTKDEINSHREEIMTKYNSKLTKVKDICAQFFSKYEKELQINQDKMKELDQKIEEWAKLIIKPQELNQARLFAIDTRMKESEEFRVKEVNFLKDTFKKLIFALEQTEFQKGQSNGPNLCNFVASERAQSSITAKHNKTITEENPLPSLMINKNRISPNVRTATVGARSKITTSQGGRQSEVSTAFENDYGVGQNSSLPLYDIMFLKRLLYLKAAIDQEHTVDTYKIPMSEDAKLNLSQQNSHGKTLDDEEYNDIKVNESNLFEKKPKTIEQKKTYLFQKHDKKSIDLQDYLNFATGLDYKKIKTKSEIRRQIRSSQVTTRDNQPDKNYGTAIVDQISKNKFITEGDKEKEKQQNDDQLRVERIKDTNYQAFDTLNAQL